MPNLWDRIFGLSGKTLAMFFRQLATMVRSGMSFVQSLDTLSRNSPGPIRRWLTDAIPKLRDGGKPFSTVFVDYPYLFSPFVSAMVLAAERSGRTDEVLVTLADHVEKAWQARVQFLVKLVHPFLILNGGLLIPPVVVWYTKGLGAYLQVVGPGFVGVYIGLFVLLLMGRTTVLKPVKMLVDSVVLYVPLVGKLVRLECTMWFVRSLAELFDAGLPVGQAVQLSAEACGNTVLANRFAQTVPLISQGRSLTDAFTEVHVLPPTVLQMMASSEASGTIPNALRKAADFIELEVTAALQAIGVVLPIIVFLGVAVYAGYQIIGTFQQIMAPLKGII